MQKFRLVTSRPVVIAALLLAVVNGLLYATNPLSKVDPELLMGARSWAWWAVQDYKKVQPDVVVTGSSMVMHPLWHQEAQYRQQNVELIVDHRSHFLESFLNKSTGLDQATSKPVKVFNFGLPGGMASDAFITVRAISQMPQPKPKVAVICLCVRDMMDNSFGCAATSRHYDLFSRLADTSDVAELAVPKPLDKGRVLLRDAVFLKRKNKEVNAVLTAQTHEIANIAYKDLPPSPLDKVSPEKSVKFAFQNDELEQGFWIAKPNVPRWYVEASADCRKRMRRTNDDVFNNQVAFLDLCLKECKQNGIVPVLVNMPTSPVMKQVLKPGMYERHMNALTTMAKKWNVELIDANQDIYTAEDFTDWAHMHATGGEKAFGIVGRALAGNKVAMKGLASPSQLPSRSPSQPPSQLATKKEAGHAF